jgi:hypothetical protein
MIRLITPSVSLLVLLSLSENKWQMHSFSICFYFRILVWKSDSILLRSWWKHSKVHGHNDLTVSKLVLFSLHYLNPLAAASKICCITRRTLRDWVSPEQYPLNKLGRNEVFQQMLENNSTKESPAYKLVLNLRWITFANMQGTEHAGTLER